MQVEERWEKMLEPLLAWFEENGRELPFRKDRNPYRIWVSEIMLQQTRIEAALPYFERFMKELPDIKSLAACEDEKLLKLWEGLGYYSRVKNLKKAAKVIEEEYGGIMPATWEALKKLPGIGPYTAGAIASIAFGEAAPAVDGNVLRVYSRLFADDRDIMKASTRTDVEKQIQKVIPVDRPGAFNEALMELGERICIPNGEPLCEACPLQAVCLAKEEQSTAKYPVRIIKKERRIEEWTYFLLEYEGALFLEKRPERGLLAGLYGLPGVKGYLSEQEAMQDLEPYEPYEVKPLSKEKHIFSHVEWHMLAYYCKLRKKREGVYATKEELESIYALPNAFVAYKNQWQEVSSHEKGTICF